MTFIILLQKIAFTATTVVRTVMATLQMIQLLVVVVAALISANRNRKAYAS